MSAYKIQTPGNHPKESMQHSGHGESLKSRGKVIGDLRKLHNEEFHAFCSSLCVVLVMKSRRIGWAGRLARMGQKTTRTQIIWKT